MGRGLLPRREAQSLKQLCRTGFGWDRVPSVHGRQHDRSKHISSSLLLCVLSPSKGRDFLPLAEISVVFLTFMGFRKQLLGLLRGPGFAERGEMSGGCGGGFLDLGKHLGFAVLRFDEGSNQVGDRRAECIKLKIRNKSRDAKRVVKKDTYLCLQLLEVLEGFLVFLCGVGHFGSWYCVYMYMWNY